VKLFVEIREFFKEDALTAWSVSTLLILCAVFVGIIILIASNVAHVKGETELLTTLPGNCQVYQVDTGSRFIYTTTCPGNVQWTESCGKACTRKEQVETK